MSARQRRGLLLLVLAGMLGLTTFVVLSNYVTAVRADVGDVVQAWRVSDDVPAFTVLTADMVEPLDVPQKWLAPGTARDVDDIVGRRTGTALPDGAYVRDEVLLPRNELNEGEREIAINVDAETGVAGRLQPGDYVNINVTLQEGEGSAGLRVAAVLVRRARIISFGTEREADRLDGSSAQVLPVTFALSEAESLRLLYAESFASSIRLSKVLPEDTVAPRGVDPFTSADVRAEFQGSP